MKSAMVFQLGLLLLAAVMTGPALSSQVELQEATHLLGPDANAKDAGHGPAADAHGAHGDAHGHAPAGHGDAHGAAHGAAHGGGHGDDHHHKNDPAASVMAVLLLGFVAFDMCLLYMLNYSDPQVQCYSYKMVCQCISIFCALLIQISVNKIVQRGIVMNVMQLFSTEVVRSSQVMHECVAFVGFTFWFMLISFASWKAHGSQEDTHAVKGIVADTAAFAAIDLFGYGQQAIGKMLISVPGSYGKVLAFYLAWPAMAFGVYAAFGLCTHFFRQYLHKTERAQQAALPAPHGHAHEHGDGGHGEHGAHGAHSHEPEWMEVASECEIDSAAIVIGFLLRQLVLVACQGTVPKMGGYITSETGAKTMQVFVLVLLVIVIGISFGISYLEGSRAHHGHHEHTVMDKVLEFVQSLSGFSLAWCILSLVLYWITVTVQFPTNQKVLVAAAISPFTAIFTIMLDKLADTGIMRESFAVKLVAILGLTTGLAWEKAFASSIDSVVEDDIIGVGAIAEQLSRNKNSQSALAEVIVYLFMLAVIVPGWKWYIVPPAAKPVPERSFDEEVHTVDKLA